MFTSSFPFAFFDYFRVPYTVDLASGAGLSDRLGVLRAAGAGPDAPALYWCRADGESATRSTPNASSVGARLSGVAK